MSSKDFDHTSYMKQYRKQQGSDWLSNRNKQTKKYQQSLRGKMALKAGSINTQAKKRGAIGRVSSSDIELLFKDGKCKICGGTENLEYDHIKPIFLGGENTLQNMQLLCKACHKEKSRFEKMSKTVSHHKHIPEWFWNMINQEPANIGNQLSLF